MEGQYPKGEYIDFCFNGKWGSEMGLTRICNGNRNQEDLLPSIKDRTTDIPGRDGQYHFYSTFDKKQFTINYAFDALTEVEVDRIKVWLGDKKLHQLYFSEDLEIKEGEWKPKKYYMAKVTSQSILKYVPFDNNISSSEGDIYKGEGSIQFTCYYPFAKQLDIERDAEVSNINSFIEGTSIVINSHIEYTNSEGVNSNISQVGTEIENPSKAPAPWIFKIGLSTSTNQKTLTLMINNTEYALDLNKEADFQTGSGGDYGFVSYENNNLSDTYLELNSRNNSIIFYKEGKIQYFKSRNNSSTKMPKLYNRILTSTTELKSIPVGDFLLDLRSNDNEIKGLFMYTPVVY